MLSLSKYEGRGGGVVQGDVRRTVPPASPFDRLRVRL